jgi:DNA polymerase I-like protein with 3'-5' exonuclease and polymerase domains
MNAPTQLPISEVQIIFCTTEEMASSAIDGMQTGAQGGTVAIDIETAPIQSEVDRLAQLRRERAVASGRLKAEVKLKRPVGALKNEIKRINAAIDNATGAGLDPHRSRIRLLQLYGGGTHATVIDIDRTGPGILRRLEDMRVVAHNAAFELAFLEKAGVTPLETHCTLQTCRLVTGKPQPNLEFAAKEFLGVELDKTLQTSDWNAPHLSTDQLRYAALDAVVCRRLARRTLLTLGQQASAYTIQMTAIPAVVRMQTRGFLLDRVAHAKLIEDLGRERAETVDAYGKACREHGVDDSVPETPERKRSLLKAILTSAEIANWAHTEKSQALSTGRSELKRALHYPPIATLVQLSILDKAISAFGENYAENVSVVTGRIHASYWVAGTVSGRAACTKPNLQQLPRDKRFRALFRAAPGCVLVVGDFNAMELRAAAHISGDHAMTEAFEQGLDLHKITASRMTGKSLADVTDEERQRAKAVNFGGIYGQGAFGLRKAAWDNYSLVLTEAEAEQWVRALRDAYPQLDAWKHANAQRCKDAGRIIIGRDATQGIGRHYLEAWVPEGKSFYTRCCNLPVQGSCADASMLALAYVDERLFEAGIEGGPVAWLHDEIVLEVREDQAEQAAEILKQSMIDGFSETFPGGPLNGLVDPSIGASWAEAKAGAPKPGKSQPRAAA